jgi:peroxiredoxin
MMYEPDRREAWCPGHLPIGLVVGNAAPPFSLPDLGGRMVALTEFRGRPVVVLFWSPACGYCQQMRHDLQEWDAESHRHERALVVISPRTAASHGSLSMRSPVLSDPTCEVARSYSVARTPMAVVVDPDGKIAAGPATCAAAVFHLLYSGLFPAPPPANCAPRV